MSDLNNRLAEIAGTSGVGDQDELVYCDVCDRKFTPREGGIISDVIALCFVCQPNTKGNCQVHEVNGCGY